MHCQEELEYKLQMTFRKHNEDDESQFLKLVRSIDINRVYKQALDVGSFYSYSSPHAASPCMNDDVRSQKHLVI